MNVYTHAPLRKTLLALAIGAAAHSAQAATTDANSKKSEDTIVVQASPGGDFKAGGDELVPAYLDGQIAHGGRLGMLASKRQWMCRSTLLVTPLN